MNDLIKRSRKKRIRKYLTNKKNKIMTNNNKENKKIIESKCLCLVNFWNHYVQHFYFLSFRLLMHIIPDENKTKQKKSLKRS